MGDYAEDLIRGSMQQENEDVDNPIIFVPDYDNDDNYRVAIVHRKTFVEEWNGTVRAINKLDAQRQFRIKYADIRSQYIHEYGLTIKPIKKHGKQ